MAAVLNAGYATASTDTGHKADGSRDPPDGVAFTCPLCPYPQVARYKGTGSVDDAANFVCRAPAIP